MVRNSDKLEKTLMRKEAKTIFRYFTKELKMVSDKKRIILITEETTLQL